MNRAMPKAMTPHAGSRNPIMHKDPRTPKEQMEALLKGDRQFPVPGDLYFYEPDKMMYVYFTPEGWVTAFNK